MTGVDCSHYIEGNSATLYLSSFTSLTKWHLCKETAWCLALLPNQGDIMSAFLCKSGFMPNVNRFLILDITCKLPLGILSSWGIYTLNIVHSFCVEIADNSLIRGTDKLLLTQNWPCPIKIFLLSKIKNLKKNWKWIKGTGEIEVKWCPPFRAFCLAAADPSLATTAQGYRRTCSKGRHYPMSKLPVPLFQQSTDHCRTWLKQCYARHTVKNATLYLVDISIPIVVIVGNCLQLCEISH